MRVFFQKRSDVFENFCIAVFYRIVKTNQKDGKKVVRISPDILIHIQRSIRFFIEKMEKLFFEFLPRWIFAFIAVYKNKFAVQLAKKLFLKVFIMRKTVKNGKRAIQRSPHMNLAF